jgi:hypothetical protein
MTEPVLPICPRCASHVPETHDCTPSALVAQLERIATNLAVKAGNVGERDASLGFEINGRTVVIAGTPEDCTTVRDTLVALLKNQAISRNNVYGLYGLLVRMTKGDESAQTEALAVVAQAEANGGIFTPEGETRREKP